MYVVVETNYIYITVIMIYICDWNAEQMQKKFFEWRGFEMVPYHLIFELRSNSMRVIQLLNSQILHYIADIMPHGNGSI